MPIDFELTSRKIYLELDGIQHFTQVSNWDAPENVQAKDVEKIQKMVEHGFIVIHLFQEEMWKDSYEWRAVLKDIIARCAHDSSPRCFFISRDPSRYDAHREQLGDSVACEVIYPSSDATDGM